MNRNQNGKQILVQKNHQVVVLSLEPGPDLVKLGHSTVLKT